MPYSQSYISYARILVLAVLGLVLGTAFDLEARRWVKKHVRAPPTGALRHSRPHLEYIDRSCLNLSYLGDLTSQNFREAINNYFIIS